MPKSDLTSSTVLAQAKLATAYIFARNGCTPSRLTTMPTNSCCGAQQKYFGQVHRQPELVEPRQYLLHKICMSVDVPGVDTDVVEPVMNTIIF